MIKGQSKFKINDNLTIGQDENGMHYAVIRDNDNTIDSVLTAFTSNELFKKLKEGEFIK